MAEPQTLIRSKTRVPAIADEAIERVRVRVALDDAARGRQILHVVATAGSGKTTAAVHFVASRPGPHAWLTLGEADGSPGRFITYLAAAIGSIEQEAPVETQALLAGGLPPADCAAILAENLPAGATVVIDDLHHVEDRPSVLQVLRAFLDAVAPGSLVVLVSRRLTHLDVSRSMLTGRAGTVSGGELAFTTEEVAELLARRGVSAVAEEVATASGGWAAGIVFEALRGPRSLPGDTLPEDPFFAYLGAEVLDALSPTLRRNVIRSALLHTVSPHGLESLLDIPSAEALYGEIRRNQLPATLEPEGLRYHPRFAEFLLSLLRREDPDEMRALLGRHARRLWSEGQVEEAADHLLAAGELYEAEEAIEVAGEAILLRGDWDKVLGWCAALGEDALVRRPILRGHQLRGLLLARRSDEMTALVEKLRATGEYDRLVREAPEAATTAVFALHVTGRWGPLIDILPAAETSPGARAMRYVLQVGSGRTPPPEWSVRDLEEVSPNVELLHCGLYFQGRLVEVEDMAALPTAQPARVMASTMVYKISAMRERGRLGDARAAFDAAAPFVPMTGFSDFWRDVEGELVFAEGERERGLHLIREARMMARERGHQAADRAIFAAGEGKMLARMGKIPEAVDLLSATRDWCIERGLPGFREWADVWLAAALLARGDDLATPIGLLEGAIEGMERAERVLELPAAYVLLAEARWRSGDEAGHDAAADAAYRACEGMATLAPLLVALESAPDVLARRLDGEGRDEDTWRALARAGAPGRSPSSLEGASVVIGTLGRACIDVGGAERDVSPLRAIEVAAAVARAGTRGLSRAALASEFFEGSADASTYLRQIVHRLRRVLPDGVTLVSDGHRLWWSPARAVVTEDQVFASLVARARREVGEERLRTLAEALEMAERGPLLPGVDTTSVHRMRDELAGIVAEVRREYAHVLLMAGRPAEALVTSRAAVAAEPYREDGWALLMRAEAVASGPAAVVPVYVECTRALAEIGLEPSPETGALLERLRGPGARAVTARG